MPIYQHIIKKSWGAIKPMGLKKILLPRTYMYCILTEQLSVKSVL